MHLAWVLAAEIFAGYYRANWKPFICHVTGVAGIVAYDSRSALPVCAALLHSALQFGRFPLLGRGRRARLAMIEDHSGPEVAELVAKYHDTSWQTVLDAIDRSELHVLAHLKLADLLDDVMDDRALIASAKKNFALRGISTPAQGATLARSVGAPRLAEQLERVGAPVAENPLVSVPRSDSFRIPSRKWRRQKGLRSQTLPLG